MSYTQEKIRIGLDSLSPGKLQKCCWNCGVLVGFPVMWVLSCRPTGPEDVRFKVLFCGICHSDLHQIKNDWGASKYPMVPG